MHPLWGWSSVSGLFIRPEWWQKYPTSGQGSSEERSPVVSRFSEILFLDVPGTATEQVRTCGLRRSLSRKTNFYILHLLFYKNVGSFQSRKSVGVFFSSILCSHKCGIIYTCFRASVLSSSLVFMWWRKTGMLIFLYIIPVVRWEILKNFWLILEKVDWYYPQVCLLLLMENPESC